eukprot:282211-Pleurochrysis_carterae.AAC.1
MTFYSFPAYVKCVFWHVDSKAPKLLDADFVGPRSLIINRPLASFSQPVNSMGADASSLAPSCTTNGGQANGNGGQRANGCRKKQNASSQTSA